MKARWRKSIRGLIWKFRPWTRLKQRETRIKELEAQLANCRRTIYNQQQALFRKRRALAGLQASHDHVIEEFRRQRCTKIKHGDKRSAEKAGHRLFNKTSHVMEPYECYICPPKDGTNEKWWHIRHAIKSMRGKNGQVEIYLEPSGE